jgi:hypothetical protein
MMFIISKHDKCLFLMRMRDSTPLQYSEHYITVNYDFSIAQMNRYIVPWSNFQRGSNCLILHLNCFNMWIPCKS